MKTFADFGIDLGGRVGTDLYVTCPKCSPDRQKSKARVLHVNTEKGAWYCNHCAWAGGLNQGERQGEVKRKVVVRPEYVAPMRVPDKLVSFFHARGIPESVVLRNKIDLGMDYMPQVEKSVETIQFPYYVGGECANVKFRSLQGKMFRQVTGARKVLFGLDDLTQQACAWSDGKSTCIMVEGEIDKLSLEVAGFVNAVSVPDGAPPVNSRPSDLKFEYLEDGNCFPIPMQRVIVAVDGDGPGKVLEEELVRRLGPDRCCRVQWPDGCKDANEVLLRHGVAELRRVIESARPCPIDGVMEASDVAEQVVQLYREGLPPGLSTGWSTVDQYYTVKPGEMTIVTGVPSHGKSEWLDALVVNLALLHGLRFAVCSPENMPLQRHLSKLIEKYVGLPFGGGRLNRMPIQRAVEGLDWIQQHFTFIVPDEAITIASLLETAKQMVTRYGIRGLIIDPWNEFDHRRPGNVSETEYISDCLGKIRRFGRTYGVHVWVVAHPSKLLKDKNGEYPVPTPYDISGSAHWRNKADNCLTIWRDVQDYAKPTIVYVQKVRFREVGKVGDVPLRWNGLNGRYEEEVMIARGDMPVETREETEVPHEITEPISQVPEQEQTYAF